MTLRQQEQADDDNQEQDTEVESKSVVNDIKSHTIAIVDYTEQLDIERIGPRQRSKTIATSGREPRSGRCYLLSRPTTRHSGVDLDRG